MGAFAYFAFAGSQGYFAAISVDLYLSIRNPFGKPDSHLKLMHYSIIIFCIVLTWILYMTDNFAWREDMQICFIAAQNVDSRNVNAVAALTVYIPAVVIIISSFAVAFYAGRRLRAGLPDTYKLRMRVLRDGFFYSLFFSLYFFAAGISYFLIWQSTDGDHTDRDHKSDWVYFVFAVTFGSLGLVDLAIWGYSKFYQNSVLNRPQKALSIDESTFYESRASLSNDDAVTQVNSQVSLNPPSKKAKKPATSPIPKKEPKKSKVGM